MRRFRQASLSRWPRLLARFLCSPDGINASSSAPKISRSRPSSAKSSPSKSNLTRTKPRVRFYLGGTYICQQALLAGRIDAYVEYTGTALTAILKDPIETNSTPSSKSS